VLRCCSASPFSLPAACHGPKLAQLLLYSPLSQACFIPPGHEPTAC
jgi:hypothetical protein